MSLVFALPPGRDSRKHRFFMALRHHNVRVLRMEPSYGWTLEHIDEAVEIRVRDRDDAIVTHLYNFFITNFQEEPMSQDKAVTQAELEVAVAIEALEKAQASLAKAKKPKNPEEPSRVVIAFSLIFNEGGRAYDYAARRSGGRWYTTGSTCPPKGYSWDELCDWIREAHWSSGLIGLTLANRVDVNII